MCFSGNIKLIWIFNTYIPDDAEKVAQRANFPGHPVYDVLKNPSLIARKIGATRTHHYCEWRNNYYNYDLETLFKKNSHQ